MGVHDGHRDRMRQRYLQEGPDGFANHELLEMILYGAIPRGDTNEIAHHLLREFGSISNLIETDPYEIAKTAGVGLKSAVFISQLHELVRRYDKEKRMEKPQLTSPRRCAEYCISLLNHCTTERFYVVCLDSRRMVIHTAKISEGIVEESAVYPRAVAEVALRYKSTGIVFCHNHPGGRVTPSNADTQLTASLKRMLAPLGVTVIDHIIVGEGQYFSFFENHLLKDEK